MPASPRRPGSRGPARPARRVRPARPVRRVRPVRGAEATSRPAAAGSRSGGSGGEPMIVPPRVVKGQTVGVVAPSGPVKLERLRQGLACLGDVFELRVAASVTAPRAPATPSYLAAPDEVRIAELTAMLADPDVRAIICARGGYGGMRVLP